MAGSEIMKDLMTVIAERRATASAGSSYVAKLMNGGVAAIGAKIIEEAAETVEAGDEPGDEGRVHLIKEAADLVFHTAVLLSYRDVAWDEVEAELANRSGVSGLVEKAARKPRPNP